MFATFMQNYIDAQEEYLRLTLERWLDFSTQKPNSEGMISAEEWAAEQGIIGYLDGEPIYKEE